MSKLLYINNQLVDLYPNTVIAQTLQAFEVGELGVVQANYTNRIKIPKTANNRRVLQFADESKSSTSFPYTSYSARYIQNGIELIRNGRIILRESGEDFQLNIFSGPIGFFDYIKTKTLWDLDTSDINSGWSDVERDAARNTTTGIVAPLVDDGLITYNGALPAIDHTGGETKHPWIYYHTVINKIFEAAGYEKEGTIFSDDKYLKLAMPLKTTYSPPFLAAKGFHAAAPGNQVIVNPSSYTNIQFTQVSDSGGDSFYDGTDSYDVVNPESTADFFHMNFRATITITVTGGTVDIALQKNNFPAAAVPIGTSLSNKGSGTYHIGGGALNLKHNDIISMRVIKNTGTPTITVTNGTFDGYALPNLSEGFVFFNHLFEEINQADIIRDFSVRFNVKMVERNGVIICKTMDEIFAEASNAVDWTSKRASDRNQLQYEFGGLARTNYFEYPSDNLVENVSDDFGKGVFTIANDNIKESQNIYESLFTMSEMIMYNDRIFIARIPAGVDGDSLGIRLCYIRQNEPSNEPNANVVYNLTARSDYKVAYFIDPRQTHSMHWQYFIDAYYTQFIARLQKAKSVSRDYWLTDVDIHTFDHMKPIFDSGELFIPIKVNNFISGKITDVELFKI